MKHRYWNGNRVKSGLLGGHTREFKKEERAVQLLERLAPTAGSRPLSLMFGLLMDHFHCKAFRDCVDATVNVASSEDCQRPCSSMAMLRNVKWVQVGKIE